MDAMNGPQWHQLPLLMTPDEVRNSHSGSFNKPMSGVAEGYRKHNDFDDVARVEELKRRFSEAPPRGDRPATLFKRPGAGYDFLDGHHRAVAAMESGHLLPVQHSDTIESYNKATKIQGAAHTDDKWMNDRKNW